MPFVTSRSLFTDYLERVRNRRKDKSPEADDAAGEDKHSKSRSFGRLLIEFLGLLKSHRLAITFALITLTISTLFKLAPPAATKFIIDYVLTDNPLPPWLASRLPVEDARLTLLWWIAGAVVALTVVESVIHLWGRWIATKAVNRMRVSVRRRAFEHAVRLPLHRVYQLKSGGAASLLRDDAGGVADLVFSMIYNPWRAIIQLLGSLAVLAYVDWRLLLGGVLVMPAVYLTHRTWINRIRPLYRDVRKQRQEIDGHATESFGGMRVVRAFGRQRSESSRFVRDNDFMVRQQLHVWWWARLIELVWEILIPVASAGLLLFGGSLVLSGHLTLGDLMMFLFYLAMLLGPLAVLATSATQFQNSLAGLERVLDLLAEPREMKPTPQSRRVDRSLPARLTFRDVSFRYPGADAMVLRDIDLEVAPGQTVALVGRSGAGKTTLCNLAARFYDPTSGAVELNGVDLRDIEVESYRTLLGVVEQDVFLFDGTIAENIAYASRGATDDEIRRAAKAAHADEFVERLEKGYDTFIGERGVKLSGGQRQRLAIARSLLADPKILILDEATSNLDTESERLIQDSLGMLLEGRTCLVIAHRLSTIAHADQIVVLDGGRIVEHGTHDELMARSGQYSQMVLMQTANSQGCAPAQGGQSSMSLQAD